MNKLYLYGPPGSGKSTLGEALGGELGIPWRDLDEEIVRQTGSTIPEIFADKGEAGFRKVELSILEKLSELKDESIISLGGGALLDDKARAVAESSGQVLFLGAPLAKLEERARRQPGARPLLEKKGTGLEDLLRRRQSHYNSFQTRLDAGEDSVNAKVAQACALTGYFKVRGMGRQDADVRVGTGILREIGARFVRKGWRGNTLVVADENTVEPYGRSVAEALAGVGISASVTVIPAGESYKTIETVVKLWDAMLEAGVDRGGTVVAVGGGVVGDLAGFAAATWMRGVRWVGVPTTLLAMVDSGLGGKTGFDLPRGKNLVGAFHPPALVIVDIDTLETLPQEELLCGAAETIKHGIIGDRELFLEFEKKAPRTAADWDARLVSRSMAVKLAVIREDPYEKGVRASLNLGHTIGHAIELASGFKLRHGEAVAVGMVAEAFLAEKLSLATEKGLARRIVELLEKFGLPVEPPSDLDRVAVERAMRLDKKNKDGELRFALPLAIGKVQTDVAVAIEEALRQIM